ncbi:type I glyceraldehyde-3-phosphate dehydrogenase [Candidatus Magnetaquicoccus inordinatus]|uniref:type I glyceraldehyde-3-phosphate dehydrogenase n=1 Tax=Candidatus Magnetaquicoccus inordinatus TaxID=2496818 RepID=UPI00102B50E9|nr:glyceraldehyde 3-phosphate dehydrogenase NAD-binding domain-containing protein [Candidatus Magnetaquicoccus inordinatus]
MTVRVGINGFGRIGRQVLRTAHTKAVGWRVVHINDVNADVDNAAHLLRYDSTHGRWDQEVRSTEETLSIGKQQISFSRWSSPQESAWDQQRVELLLECTGQYKGVQSLQPCLQQGVATVLVATPILHQSVLNVVMGVNEKLYDPHKHQIITAASCTTNSVAPVLRVILQALGVVRGSITTIHAANSAQNIVDGYRGDWRRGRAASISMFPTTTSAARTIGTIFPQLAGKMDGMAVRVPLLHASLTDLTLEVARPTSVAEVNALLQQAAQGELQGILGYSVEPLVSIDYSNESRSAVIDALSTQVIDQKLVKILAWYDNESGYCNRLVELINHVLAQKKR